MRYNLNIDFFSLECNGLHRFFRRYSNGLLPTSIAVLDAKESSGLIRLVARSPSGTMSLGVLRSVCGAYYNFRLAARARIW